MNGCFWPKAVLAISISSCTSEKFADCHEGPEPTADLRDRGPSAKPELGRMDYIIVSLAKGTEFVLESHQELPASLPQVAMLNTKIRSRHRVLRILWRKLTLLPH